MTVTWDRPQPCFSTRSRMFIVGKQQTAYLLDATKLGGIGGQSAVDQCLRIQGWQRLPVT